MQNLEPKTKGRLFLESKIQNRNPMSLHFPPLPLPKYWRSPHPHLPISQIDRLRNLLQCEQVWVRTKRQRHGDKRCWGHPYLWNMTKNKIAWSGLVSLDDGQKAFEHLMDPFLYWSHLPLPWVFFVRIFVSENPSFLLLLTATLFAYFGSPELPLPFVTCYFITTKSQI